MSPVDKTTRGESSNVEESLVDGDDEIDERLFNKLKQAVQSSMRNTGSVFIPGYYFRRYRNLIHTLFDDMPGAPPKTFADKLERSAYEYCLKAKMKAEENVKAKTKAKEIEDESDSKDTEDSELPPSRAPIRIPNSLDETKVLSFIKGICKIFAEKGLCDIDFIDNDWLTNEILEQLNQDGFLIIGYKNCYCKDLEEKHLIYETCTKWEKIISLSWSSR